MTLLQKSDFDGNFSTFLEFLKISTVITNYFVNVTIQ